MIFSKRAEQISPSITLAITDTAKRMKKEGIDVIGFGAGEPDFNTPMNIQDAAIKAMRAGFTKYTAASGIPELKKAVCTKFKNDNNLNYSPSQVIISSGAKQCITNVLLAVLNPGDEVIISVPYWVSYTELIKLADGIPAFAETSEENNFKYTIDVLNKTVTSKTKAILLNSPNNPTGTVYMKDELEQIANFAKEHDLIIISDEIYEKLIYDDVKHVSIASLSDDAYNRTVIINGVSKTYAMTGWRIGYAVGPQKIIKLMSNIQSHTTSNPNSIAQYAALEALTGSQNDVVKMVSEFKKRRDYMVEKVNSIKDLSCLLPQGAFYVFINISKLIGKNVDGEKISNSLDFSRLLLEKEKVAVVPGDGFGMANFIRLSYATSMDNIINGLKRIEKFINAI